MAVWNEQRLLVLFGFVVRCEDLFDMIINRLNPRHLARDFSQVTAGVLLSALAEHKETFKEMPKSVSTFSLSIDKILSQYPEADRHTLQEIYRWIPVIFELEQKMLDAEISVGQALTRSFIQEYFINPQYREVANGNMSEIIMTQKLHDLQKEQQALAITEVPQAFYPLKEPQLYINPKKSIPLGLPVWDALFPGGLAHSEVYLILGATGGGKTLYAIQIGNRVAEKGGRVYHATFEEQVVIRTDPENEDSPLRSEFTVRALGVSANITKNELKSDITDGTFYDTLRPDFQTRMKTIQDEPVAKNWAVYGYVSLAPANKTIAALFRNVRQEHEKNPIKLLVIDPLWPLVQATADGLGIPSDRLRTVADAMKEEFNSFCKELGITLLITHQIGAGAATGSAKQLTTYSSGEIKTLANRFENVLVISRPHDTTKECYMVCAKNRNSGEMNNMIRVWLDGNSGVFKVVTEDVQSTLVDAQGVPGSFVAKADDIAALLISDQAQLITEK